MSSRDVLVCLVCCLGFLATVSSLTAPFRDPEASWMGLSSLPAAVEAAEKCRHSGRLDEAEQLLRGALDESRNGDGRNEPVVVAVLLGHLALVAQDRPDLGAAEKLLSQAFSIAERELGVSHPFRLWTMVRLGSVLRSQRLQGRSELYLDRVLVVAEDEERHRPRKLADRIFRSLSGEERSRHRAVAELRLDALNELARLRSVQGRLFAAEHLLLEALDHSSESAPTIQAAFLNNLATVYFEQGRPDAAETRLEQAQRLLSSAGDPSPKQTAATWNNRGLVQAALGRTAPASRSFANALGALEGVAPADHPMARSIVDNGSRVGPADELRGIGSSPD